MIRNPADFKPLGLLTQSKYQGQGPIGSSGTFGDQRLVQTPKGGVLLVLPSATIHTWTIVLNNGTQLVLNGVTSPFVQSPFGLDSAVFESIQIDVADPACQYVSLSRDAIVPFVGAKSLSEGGVTTAFAQGTGENFPQPGGTYGGIVEILTNPSGSGVIMEIDYIFFQISNPAAGAAGTCDLDLGILDNSGAFVPFASVITPSLNPGQVYYGAVSVWMKEATNSIGSITYIPINVTVRLRPGESIVARGECSQTTATPPVFICGFDYSVDHL